MCSLIGAVEPLLNPVWVFIFDGEHPGPWALVGGIIVIVTITCWCMAGGGTRKEETA
jgi:drug/metabolite transporter (DMT)-like permease